MHGNSLTLVLGQSINCIILDFFPMLRKNYWSHGFGSENPTEFKIVIKFALMQNELLKNPYLKGRF